ncbi:MAG: DNA damage-inducible protein D [Chloroflexi bacterium]|nr:MAG: DNA damage-inducible protein D [Chloroflexota bacterium]
MNDEMSTRQGEGVSDFDLIRHVEATSAGEVEFWYARELSGVLGYSNWSSFGKVIHRAKVALNTAGLPVDNHFEHLLKMVSIGYGNSREIEDYRLTRYACYMIAQNGNPTIKPRVAQAQAYFAVQTRKRELQEQYEEDMKRLSLRKEFSESDKRISGAILGQDIAPRGLGIIKTEGDKKFFGGKNSQDMKKVYQVADVRTPWANRAPNVVLAAKTLANELTANNVEKYGITGFPNILDENNGNNQSVRETLIDRGVTPETEQPAEDTKIIQRRVQQLDRTQITKNLDD